MITIDEVFQYSVCKLYENSFQFKFGPGTGRIRISHLVPNHTFWKNKNVSIITEINLEKLYTYLVQEKIITEDEKNYLLKL